MRAAGRSERAAPSACPVSPAFGASRIAFCAPSANRRDPPERAHRSSELKRASTNVAMMERRPPASPTCSPMASVRGSSLSPRRSACSVSYCELTATYSPAAIESAPANSAAAPAITIADRLGEAVATPMIRPELASRPSLAPEPPHAASPAARPDAAPRDCARSRPAGQARDHPAQQAVAPDVLVNQRSTRMKRSHHQDGVGTQPVQVADLAPGRRVQA